MFDSRAATYEKLGRTKEALLDAKQAIKLSPEKWQVSHLCSGPTISSHVPQGYARSARLFMTIKKYDSSLKMIDLALERVNTKDAKRRAELQSLRSDIQSAQTAFAEKQRRHASRTFYHFGKLPIEIAFTIFSNVVEADHAQVVVLGQVCRDWRRVVIETPSLWTHLTLSTKHPVAKATLWNLRNHGRLKTLCIRAGETKRLWALDALAGANLESLRTLSLEYLDFQAFRQHLPSFTDEAIARLTSLELLEVSAWQDLCASFRPQGLQLRNLVARDTPVHWADLADNSGHLVTLSYNGWFDRAHMPDFIWLLHRNPGLQKLDFFAAHTTTTRHIPILWDPRPRDLPERLSLPSLTELALGGPWLPTTFITGALGSARPRILHLSRCAGVLDLGLQRLVETGSASQLEELVIDRCMVSAPEILVECLRAAKSLVTLRLTSTTDVGAVLEALAERDSTGEISCPKLSTVDFSQSFDVRDGALIRLVKLRCPPLPDTPADDSTRPVEVAPSSEEVSRITSLTVDGCQTVSPDILPWLRKNVAHVSCKYATKKQANWKR